MPSGTVIAPPRCHPPPDGGTLRHVNNSLPGPVSKGSVYGNGSRQPDNWLLALAEPFVTVLAHGNGVNVKIHKMQIQVTCATSKCKPIGFKFCMRGFPITAQYPTKGRSKIFIFNFSNVRYGYPTVHGKQKNAVPGSCLAVIFFIIDDDYK